MGYEMRGWSATAPEGHYFRMSRCCWGLVWDVCREIVPDIVTEDVSRWTEHSQGMQRDDARLLGETLLAAVSQGQALSFAQRRRAGTPRATPATAREGRTQTVRPLEGYAASEELDLILDNLPAIVQGFGRFCIASGGFSVW